MAGGHGGGGSAGSSILRTLNRESPPPPLPAEDSLGGGGPGWEGGEDSGVEVAFSAAGWQFNRIKKCSKISPKSHIEMDTVSHIRMNQVYKLLQVLYIQHQKGSRIAQIQ